VNFLELVYKVLRNERKCWCIGVLLIEKAHKIRLKLAEFCVLLFFCCGWFEFNELNIETIILKNNRPCSRAAFRAKQM